MRPTLIFMLLFLFSITNSAFAADSDFSKRLALAETIVELSQADQLSTQLTDGLLESQMQAMDVILADTALSDRQKEQIVQDVLKVIAEELEPAIQEFSAKTAPLLADVYTLEELEGILAFYKSPAGAAMLAKQRELVEKSMLIGQEWNAKNLPGAMQRMQPRIQKIFEDAKKNI
ncbi:MAG: DUF2059 domain-containing protein [Pseudomonadota bacterium]